jgi:hypothetical protein
MVAHRSARPRYSALPSPVYEYTGRHALRWQDAARNSSVYAQVPHVYGPLINHTRQRWRESNSKVYLRSVTQPNLRRQGQPGHRLLIVIPSRPKDSPPCNGAGGTSTANLVGIEDWGVPSLVTVQNDARKAFGCSVEFAGTSRLEASALRAR